MTFQLKKKILNICTQKHIPTETERGNWSNQKETPTPIKIKTEKPFTQTGTLSNMLSVGFALLYF